MDLVEIVSLVNLLSNVTATFVPVAKTMASDPEGQLSDQPDIPANIDVSEVVINCVVSKDNLFRWCGLKIATRPSRCA